jgi:hypothetical protein
MSGETVSWIAGGGPLVFWFVAMSLQPGRSGKVFLLWVLTIWMLACTLLWVITGESNWAWGYLSIVAMLLTAAIR